MNRVNQKINVTLIPLLAMLAGSMYSPVFATGVPEPARAAQVEYIGQNRGGPFAVFNQGSDSGFVIGRDVCFYTADAKKITCAVIVRTKPQAAAVMLGSEEKAKVTKGHFVWPADLAPFDLSLTKSLVDTDTTTSTDVSELSEEDDAEDPPEPLLPPLLSRRIQLHLAPTLSLPIWMNDLRFNSGARAAGTGEIWESGDTIRGSVIGFGIRYHIPQFGAGDSAFDFTYHFVPQNPVKDDFDLTDGSVAVQSAVWSHHYRFRWLRGATWRHTDDSDLLLYTGFGYDILMAKFRSAKTGGSTDELVSGTITGHGLEIPVVVAWQKHFGDWMVTTGADMALPLGVFGVQSKGKLSYDENTADADKSLNSAIDAVNVRRGWFSLALQFGVGATF